jgi:hypothetical protein
LNYKNQTLNFIFQALNLKNQALKYKIYKEEIFFCCGWIYFFVVMKLFLAVDVKVKIVDRGVIIAV